MCQNWQRLKINIRFIFYCLKYYIDTIALYIIFDIIVKAYLVVLISNYFLYLLNFEVSS